MAREDKVLKALENLDAKFDKHGDRLSKIEAVQAKQEANLGEHMRRTDLAEENIKLLRADLKPVQTHVAYMNGIFKGIGILVTIVGLLAGLVKLVEFISRLPL